MSSGDAVWRYCLREAGGVPDGGRVGADRVREAESAADRDTESARGPRGGETISSGGSIDGQKSWSKKAGTSTRRL